MKYMKLALLLSALAMPMLPSLAAAEPVTLNFWVAWDPLQADAKAALVEIAKFEAANPDIKIKIQTIAFEALHDKLVTSIASGDAPDVSWGLAEWLGELSRMNALEDLTPLVASWPDKDKLYPSAVEALTVNGKLEALPNYLGLRGLIYHADMLKKAGIAEPPKTWTELVDDSIKIKQATGKFGFGIAGKGVRSPQEVMMYLAQNDVQIAVKQADGSYKNDWADNPAELKRVGEVFAFYRQMHDKGVIPPQSSGWGWEEEDANFALGQYAMVVNGSWMRGRIEANPETMSDVLVAAPAAGLKSATYYEIAPFFVYKGKHTAESWKFASFMESKEFMSAVNPERAPRSDVVGGAVWGKPFTDMAPIGVSFPPVALAGITRALEESIGRVLLKNENPDDVAVWLGKTINRSLR